MGIDDELKAAGMLTVKELMDGQPLDGFVAHAGVDDLAKFSQWLDMRTKEMMSMKARMLLDNNDDSELFEWVLAHCAVFSEVRINFNNSIKSH